MAERTADQEGTGLHGPLEPIATPGLRVDGPFLRRAPRTGVAVGDFLNGNYLTVFVIGWRLSGQGFELSLSRFESGAMVETAKYTCRAGETYKVSGTDVAFRASGMLYQKRAMLNMQIGASHVPVLRLEEFYRLRYGGPKPPTFA